MSEPSSPAPSNGSTRGLGWRLINVALAALIALIALVVYYLPALAGRPLSDESEARVAVVTREMLQSGDWVLPKISGQPSVKEPPLSCWLAALTCKVFVRDYNNTAAMTYAVQVPPALCAALAVFIVALIGCSLFGRAGGLSAGLILAASRIVALFAQSGYGDSTLMLACAASAGGIALLLTEKPRLSAALFTGFALGAGILTKGLVPLLLLVLPVAIELLLRHKILAWRHAVYLALALVIALLVAAPWFILVERKNPGAIREMAAEASDTVYRSSETAPRATELQAEQSSRNRGVFYYLYRGALGFMPWTPLAALALLVVLWPAYGSNATPSESASASRFFALYAGIGFLILLMVQRKQPQYLLTLWPALSLAAAGLFARFNTPGGVREERMGWALFALSIAGAIFICAAPLWPSLISALDKSGFVATRAREFAAINWLAIPAALVFFVVNYLCARFWVHARSVIAVSLYAALAAAFLVYSALRYSTRTQRDSTWASIQQLQREMATQSPSIRLFAAEPDRTLAIFQTGKPFRELAEFVKPAPEDSPATILIRGKQTHLLGVDLSNAAREFDDYMLIELPAGSPLEAKLREALAHATPRP
ncbi:MAG TPA: glycosyltransferase family 39 protein [Planctomycetota bacterium]|nr:glycosyltransferase family 39 protein [Planctomycetota bacterium]